MEKNNKSRREQLIEAYRLTKEEIAYLDLCHTDTWFNHKEPQMYIMSARRALTKYHCSEWDARFQRMNMRIMVCVADAVSHLAIKLSI